jgi:diguanylate cyclase (GGDEF)-like protein
MPEKKDVDRRTHPRQPISIGALVHPEKGRSWLCAIRDFCHGGMLLVGTGGSRSLLATGADPKAGDALSLHFTVPTPKGEQHFRMQATIARVLDSGNGMGIRLPNGLPQKAFEVLMDFAVASGMVAGSAAELARGPKEAGAATGTEEGGQAPASETAPGEIPEAFLRDRRIRERDAEAVKDQLRRVTTRAVNRISKLFFEKCDRDLLLKARDAGTNAGQMMYFEGLDQLEKQRDGIRAKFGRAVLAQIDQISDLETVLEKRRKRETGSSLKLQLVDTEEFEEWLAVAEVISKTENRFSELLLDIRSQLALIAKPWGHKDVVPIGPAAITWAFADALSPIEVRRQVRQDIFKEFEIVLHGVLVNFYPAVGKMLEETGVFPSLEELREAMARSMRRTAPPPRPPPAQNYQELDAPVREAAMAADGISMAPRAAQNPFAPRTTGTAEVYKAARELLSLGRRARRMQGAADEVQFAPPDAPPDQRYEPKDILHAISQIEGELGDAPLTDRRLKPRLMEVLRQSHGGKKAFGEELYDTLDVMENLVDSIEQDKLLTEGIRDWVKRLELTLNKLATKEPEFLDHDTERPHSAVQVLNQLAKLGNAQDVRVGIDREIGHRVDELLERIVEDYDKNPAVFEDVLEELSPLVDRQARAYRGNVERTVRASEGQQKLARARRAVAQRLQPNLAGKSVPDLFLKLLNPGWRNLLVHTYLRHGPNSNEWRDASATAEEVLAQLQGESKPGDDGYVAPEALLKRVVAGLNSISFEPGKRTPLVMGLSDALIGDASGTKAQVKLAPIGPDETEKALGLEGLLPEREPEIDTDDETVRKSWTKALDRARRISVGEWLAMTDEGKPLILTVAFIGDDYASFVLVNRKGVKTREIPLKDMADGLHEGRVTLLDDFDLPLMERASQRMLQNMHNKLTYQASHDDLTDLLNRKEFERSIDAAIASAKATGVQHALLYLDLDQFKIVNNSSGHTAGDELLKMVGKRLVEGLSDLKATVARLGGDEFGVLLTDIDTQLARETAERLLKLMREQRFDWEERHFSLSASIGVVFIDEGTANADSAMRSADEACYAAKDAGRNRMQEYEIGDARMMRRRGVMEWVTQLDKAVDDGRLILNCQRISPVQSQTNGLANHYEILLTMRDELGDLMPPSEFILAAETYNRVTMVDRWVVENVFRWMADHRNQLDNFGGFSINVSGHSVNDESFADFVLDQFSRTQAPTSKICFEITETAAIANLDNARDFMNRMKIIGCRFSLDDFGTGLSSYSYLRNLPVDFVKIDGVFIKELDKNPSDYAVVRSINEIGHYLGKKTIAEFVENDAILTQLREIGVDYAQGYGIEKPGLLESLKIN